MPRCLFKIPRRNMADRLRPGVPVVVSGGLVEVDGEFPGGLVGVDGELPADDVGVPDIDV